MNAPDMGTWATDKTSARGVRAAVMNVPEKNEGKSHKKCLFSPDLNTVVRQVSWRHTRLQTEENQGKHVEGAGRARDARWSPAILILRGHGSRDPEENSERACGYTGESFLGRDTY